VTNHPHNQATKLGKHYYHENFHAVLEFVDTHYRHLFSPGEKQFYQKYKSLNQPAQQLFIRLASRSRDTLRKSKIQYDEVQNLEACLEHLGNCGLISQPDTLTVEQCVSLFSRKEIENVLGLTIPTNDIADLDKDYWQQQDLFGQSPVETLSNHDKAIVVHHKDTLAVQQLLYFGNLYQDSKDFVLRDLGLRRYENYQIDAETLFFQSRNQVDAHLKYYDCLEEFDSARASGVTALQALYQQLPHSIDNHQYDSKLCRRVDKLKNAIARQLERENQLDAAAAIYITIQLPPARERLARIYAKQNNPAASLQLCRDIQTNPHDCEELDFAHQFGARLAKKANKDFRSPKRYEPPQLDLTLSQTLLGVEREVAVELTKTGKCYYLENALFNGVFGLAFWDIIFAPVNGVFLHPFHNAPIDLYDSDFALKRKNLLDARLVEIANGKLPHYVYKHLYEKRGLSNPLVAWQLLNRPMLHTALQRIPVNHWQSVFSCLLQDLRQYRSGQPDLVYFPDTGGYQLIEVKAPGDRLQNNQQRWMQFYQSNGIPHAVLHVNWHVEWQE